MLLLDKIDMAISENEKLCDVFYACEGSEKADVNWDITSSVNLVNMFISIVPVLKNMGLEVEEDIPKMQIERLKEGLERIDLMRVADCLKYEINDTLLTLKELVLGGIIKNEELL